MVSFSITIIAIYLKAYVFFRMNANGAEMAPKMRGFFFTFFPQWGQKMYDNLKRNYIGSI